LARRLRDEFIPQDWEQLEHAENGIGHFERGKMRLGTQALDHLLKNESADHAAKLKRVVEDMRRLIADIA